MAVLSPQKLQQGDSVRIIAPARSLSIIAPEIRMRAEQTLQSLGLNVSYGAHVEERDEFDSSSISSRIKDLHDAFRAPYIKAILTVIGGFNSNQLLKYIDWKLIKEHPKVLCGYSDITALQNAIYAKTGVITYSGPHFSSFGHSLNSDYTIEYFKRCLFEDKPFPILPSKMWNENPWRGTPESKMAMPNGGWWYIKEGDASGFIMGSNLCTFNLLQGTEYFPPLRDGILFLEADDLVSPQTFDRDLQSLLHQPGFDGIRGVVIGRFQNQSRMTRETLRKIIFSKQELGRLPVLANVDFGHTDPRVTFPIGGIARLRVAMDSAGLEILEH